MQFSTKTILALSIMYASTIVVHGRLSTPKGPHVDDSTRQLEYCLAEGEICINDTDKCCVGECQKAIGGYPDYCPYNRDIDGSTRQLAACLGEGKSCSKNVDCCVGECRWAPFGWSECYSGAHPSF